MIDKTIFAVSPDEARYNLSGVYVESNAPGTARMVATDGHRLSMIDREVPGFTMEGGAIIPRKGLTELRKILDQRQRCRKSAQPRRPARVAEARPHRSLDAPGRGRISRLSRRNPQAVEVQDHGQARSAVRGDQARGDFLQRAIPWRQVRAVGRDADGFIDQSRDGRSERDDRRRFQERRIRDRIQRIIRAAGARRDSAGRGSSRTGLSDDVSPGVIRTPRPTASTLTS